MSTNEDVYTELKSTGSVDETTTTNQAPSTPVVSVAGTSVFEDVQNWIIYLLIMIVGDAVVYVGSTYRDEVERGQEHLNICGGSPRVAIAFAQKQFQPRNQSFRIEVAWSGTCTRQQARGIEQYFIEKHNTRVYPRPTNGVTRDIDLISGAQPLQLNIMNASTDRAMVGYAETRVKRDSAIVSTDVFEQLRVKQRLEVVALELDMDAQRTSLSVLERITAKYDAMPITQTVSIAQFQGDLNEVLKSNSDENKELRNSLSCLLLYYNMDHRGADFTLCAGVAAGHFDTMLRVARPAAQTKTRRGSELPLEASKRQRSLTSQTDGERPRDITGTEVTIPIMVQFLTHVVDLCNTTDCILNPKTMTDDDDVKWTIIHLKSLWKVFRAFQKQFKTVKLHENEFSKQLGLFGVANPNVVDKLRKRTASGSRPVSYAFNMPNLVACIGRCKMAS
jgi:hypothetical protein